MNLEELVRAAFAEEGRPEPAETGAYDRFRRVRYGGGLAGGTLAVVALLVALAALAPRVLTRPEQVTGPPGTGIVVTKPDRGFELTVPAGWRQVQVVDRWPSAVSLTATSLRSGGWANITVSVGTFNPEQYPGRHSRPGQVVAGPGGLRRSYVREPYTEARRPDGRAYIRNQEDAYARTYVVAWPYHCPPGIDCPAEGTLRAMFVGVTADKRAWPEAAAVAARLVQAVRPITNAVAPPSGPGFPGLDVGPTVRVATGGSGRTAWTLEARRLYDHGAGLLLRFPRDRGVPQRSASGLPRDARDVQVSAACLDRWPDPVRGPHARTALLYGVVAKRAATVRIELTGAPAVQVPALGRDQPLLPASLFVSPPLAPDAHVRGVVALDGRGRELGRTATPDEYPTLCVGPVSAFER